MNSSKIILTLTILSSLVAGLQIFDWSAFLTKDQTIAVMAGLSSSAGVLILWLTPAEAYAKNMIAAQTSSGVELSK